MLTQKSFISILWFCTKKKKCRIIPPWKHNGTKTDTVVDKPQYLSQSAKSVLGDSIDSVLCVLTMKKPQRSSTLCTLHCHCYCFEIVMIGFFKWNLALRCVWLKTRLKACDVAWSFKVFVINVNRRSTLSGFKRINCCSEICLNSKRYLTGRSSYERIHQLLHVVLMTISFMLQSVKKYKSCEILRRHDLWRLCAYVDQGLY